MNERPQDDRPTTVNRLPQQRSRGLNRILPAVLAITLLLIGAVAGALAQRLASPTQPTLTITPAITAADTRITTPTTIHTQAAAVPTTIVPTTAPPTTVVPTVPSATPTLNPGSVRRDSRGVEQVYVPAGCFIMGSDPTRDLLAQDDEQPAHQVCLTRAYWIDKLEVSNAAFLVFVQANGYSTEEYWSPEGWAWLRNHHLIGPRPLIGFDAPLQPRVGVSWYEASAYAAWSGGLLPTEAQWEYAARGPSSNIYPWGNTFSSGLANTGNTPGRTSAVGSYPLGASWVNAQDLLGNAWEWTQDYYGDGHYYRQYIRDNPTGPSKGSDRVGRGGGWGWEDEPLRLRAAYRNNFNPATRDTAIGFRVVSPAN
jgi:formylglycine-generating enzyme required for sulfatase activity